MKKNNKVLILCLAALLLLPACGAPTTPSAATPDAPTWQEQYDLGLRLLSEGNYEEAIIAFTAAIEIDAKQAPAYVGRGDAYAGSGETGDIFELAKTDYIVALELDKLLVEVYQKLADIYIASGEIESALAILKTGYDITGSEYLNNRLNELKELNNLSTTVNKYVTKEEFDSFGFPYDVTAWDVQERLGLDSLRINDSSDAARRSSNSTGHHVGVTVPTADEAVIVYIDGDTKINGLIIDGENSLIPTFPRDMRIGDSLSAFLSKFAIDYELDKLLIDFAKSLEQGENIQLHEDEVEFSGGWIRMGDIIEVGVIILDNRYTNMEYIFSLEGELIQFRIHYLHDPQFK